MIMYCRSETEQDWVGTVYDNMWSTSPDLVTCGLVRRCDDIGDRTCTGTGHIMLIYADLRLGFQAPCPTRGQS